MIVKEFESKEFPHPYLGMLFYPYFNVKFAELLTSFKNISEDKDVKIQAFDLTKVVSYNHIVIAAYHANKAFINKTNLSKSIDIEFLLYLSCQRQIKLAFETFGISNGRMLIGIAIFGKNKKEFENIKKKLDEILPFENDENPLAIPDKDVENEILNKMALLALEK